MHEEQCYLSSGCAQSFKRYGSTVEIVQLKSWSWLTQLQIRIQSPRVTLTATQQVNINWLSIVIIPGFIFASGVYSWWRRR